MLEAVIEVRSRETLSWTSKPMCRCFVASDLEPFQRMSLRHYIWASLGREDLLKKGMATHSSTLAWKIPWTGEPDTLQSMGSQSAGHNRKNLLAHSHTLFCVQDWHSCVQLFIEIPGSAWQSIQIRNEVAGSPTVPPLIPFSHCRQNYYYLLSRTVCRSCRNQTQTHFLLF